MEIRVKRSEERRKNSTPDTARRLERHSSYKTRNEAIPKLQQSRIYFQATKVNPKVKEDLPLGLLTVAPCHGQISLSLGQATVINAHFGQATVNLWRKRHGHLFLSLDLGTPHHRQEVACPWSKASHDHSKRRRVEAVVRKIDCGTAQTQQLKGCFRGFKRHFWGQFWKNLWGWKEGN